jgi:hypothetical protein
VQSHVARQAGGSIGNDKPKSQVQEIGLGQILSGVGRGIALDRDGDYN